MEKVIDIVQRQREADIHRHRQTDDLGRRLEIAERISHPGRLEAPFPVSSWFCLTIPAYVSDNPDFISISRHP